MLEVSSKEGADADSRKVDKYNVLQVVKLFDVNKRVGTEGVACLKLNNNPNELVYYEFKNIEIMYQMVVVVGL